MTEFIVVCDLENIQHYLAVNFNYKLVFASN